MYIYIYYSYIFCTKYNLISFAVENWCFNGSRKPHEQAEVMKVLDHNISITHYVPCLFSAAFFFFFSDFGTSFSQMIPPKRSKDFLVLNSWCLQLKYNSSWVLEGKVYHLWRMFHSTFSRSLGHIAEVFWSVTHPKSIHLYQSDISSLKVPPKKTFLIPNQ